MCPRANNPGLKRYFDVDMMSDLLELQDVMSEESLRNPDIFDADGDICLFVMKKGSASGLTVGRANGIFSYVREYFCNNTHHTSKEWAILNYGCDSRNVCEDNAFFESSDSGFIIIDRNGRIGGLLTGAAGKSA
ncbi:hypothetical protein TWF696_000112 [Orbilia brochopaga]|uniref:Uncharacterized protein n=1 Tax=Orbilia brochopaga TaxID=3140254 RepID=A0AAV9VD26_9PEZI